MAATEWMIAKPSWTTMAITMHSWEAVVKLKTLNLLEGPYPIPKEIFQNLKAARLFNRDWNRFKLTVQVVPLHIHFRFLKLFLQPLLCNTLRLCTDHHKAITDIILQRRVMTLHFLDNLTGC